MTPGSNEIAAEAGRDGQSSSGLHGRAAPGRTARRWSRGAAALAMAALCVLAGPRQAGAQEAQVSSEQVQAAVQKGLAYLRQQARFDGGWSDQHSYPGGVTALCAMAMLNAGVPADDPKVAGGLAILEGLPNTMTYVVSLKCQALAAANPKKYAAQLQAGANWLAKAQLQAGTWTYSQRLGGGDNSNTQFALLGLHEAAKAGAKVAQPVWRNSASYFLNTQNPDGGWGYTAGPRRQSYGSMTAAGLASLIICGQRLNVGGPKVFQNGAYPGCGRYMQNKAIAAGINWLTKNFSVEENPKYRATMWLHYYLYGLERTGMISGLRTFGPHDWYRRGAAFLAATQQAGGSWTDNGGPVTATAFAVLFLAKGNRPVLVQKIQWQGNWNRNVHDLENLTGFLGDKLGKPVTWQTTTLDCPLAQLRTSPMLLLTGHEFPAFSQAEKQLLRQYVESGGLLVAEACCGSQAFRDGFRALAEEVFPEYALRPLPGTHPVFSSHYRIEDTYGLEGINVGCRTGVLFSPNALDCLWELQDVPDWSDKAFRLGTNIAAYATGSQPLPDKLDVLDLPPPVEHAKQAAEVPRGAVRIAQLMHNGDYNADPHAMVNLAAMLRDQAKVNVVSQARHVRANDEKLYEYPVLFMQGHFAFQFSPEETAALRKYLQRGGLLVADACCGRPEFDKGFRQLAAQLFPDRPLESLPKDHPIYTGQAALPLGEVQYRPILAEELKARGTAAPLEAVRIDGRTVILYSKYDFSCALEGDNPFSCRGYLDADGRRLAMNIILYAISY